jgi:hypothetical protein
VLRELRVAPAHHDLVGLVSRQRAAHRDPDQCLVAKALERPAPEPSLPVVAAPSARALED